MHGMRVIFTSWDIPSVVRSSDRRMASERFKVYSGWWFLIVILGEMIQFDYIIFVEMGWFNSPTSDCCSIVVFLFVVYPTCPIVTHTHTDVSISWAQQMVLVTSSIAIGLGNPTLSFSCFLGTTGSKRKECIVDILPISHFKSNHTLQTSINIQKYTAAPEKILLTRPKK